MKTDGGILVLIGLGIALVGTGPLLFGYDGASEQAFMVAATGVGGFFIVLGLLTGSQRVSPFSTPQRVRFGADRTEVIRGGGMSRTSQTPDAGSRTSH